MILVAPVSNREKYALYLHTKWWAMMRYKALVRDKWACVKCGSKKKVSVDHINYPGFGKEKLEDVQTLCLECHSKETAYYDMKTERDKVWEVS